MHYLFLIAGFNAIFFALLLLQKKMARHDKILLYWLVYLGFYTGIYGLFSHKLFTDYYLLSASFVSLLMLNGPFLYLYISSLIQHSFRLNAGKLLHFLPFLLFNLYLFIASFSPGISEGIRLNHAEHVSRPSFLFNLFLTLTVLSGPVYFLLSIQLFKKLDINIFNNFSSDTNVNLNWLRKLVYSFGIIWTMLMVTTTIHHIFHLFSLTFCTDGISLSLSFFVILIGYFGLRQKEIFPQEIIEGKNAYLATVKNKEKYAGISMTEEELNDCAEKISIFVETEKAYLNPDLSLPQLAEILDIPSHHLSRVINDQFGVNFFNFINRYRIEEIKAKIDDLKFQNLSILGIAYDSGFNSKSAFNRVFKKMEGMTPSEYRKQLPKLHQPD
jgi:AraC-like DNA-binding protein